MQVEILNPQKRMSYIRPHNHQDVQEAFNTNGYSVRIIDHKEAIQTMIELEAELLTAKIALANQSARMTLAPIVS